MTKIRSNSLENYGQTPRFGGVLQLLVHGNLVTEFSVGKKPLVIGRSPDSDIVLPDSAISRRHAKIFAENGAIKVKDLGSAHGIIIGGQAVAEGVVRSNGEFSILQYQFKYVSNSDLAVKQGRPDSATGISDRGAASKQEDASRSLAATSTAYYDASGGSGPMFDGSTFLAEILDAIREQWRLIAACLLAGLIIGLLHGFLAEPTFETNALVQVEPKSREIGGPFSDFENSRRTNDALVDEVEVLQSRSVLGEVVDELSLSVKASPSYFPIVGTAIARMRSDGSAVQAPILGMDRFAWSNESIVVDSMTIPDRFIRSSFEIIAGGNGAFKVVDSENNTLARGRVGEPLSGWLPSDEPSSLFISELNANPGTVFNVTSIPRLEAIANLRESLGISNAGIESSILELSLAGSDPARIETIVNKIVTTYVMRNVQKQSEDATRTLQFVEEQIPIAKEKMESTEARLSALRLSRGSVDLPRDTQVVLDKIVRLETQISELQRSRAELIERFTPRHPRVQSLDAQLGDLGRQLDAAEADVRELPTTEREVLSISREVAVASGLYVSLVNRAQELQVVSAYAATTGNVRVVDYASQPVFPFRPNKPLLLTIYLLLGFLTGAGIILFQRQLRNVVRDPELIEARLGLPIYATLTHSGHQASLHSRASDAGTRILAVSNPVDPAIEAMRSLRTSLQFAFVNAENNVLLITGPTARIGKTFVASNLAAVLAASGRSVVVIDADLRRGTLHEKFNLSREPGLADVIGGEISLSEVTHQTEIVGLQVISAGAIPPNPSELLMHERFAAYLSELSAQYDHVIIDSPPVLAVTDAVLLGRLAGVVLLVARCDTHPLREIEQSVRQLTRVGANLKGVVFNDMPAHTGNVYGYKPYQEYERSVNAGSRAR